MGGRCVGSTYRDGEGGGKGIQGSKVGWER